METASLVAMFIATFFAVFLPLFLSSKRWRAAEDRARASRIADAKMNARLLRLNL